MTQALMLLSAGEAQRLTQRIKLTASSVRDGLFKLRNLVEEAKRSNVWQVLGYPSWTAYLADTLADEPMRLGRDERQQLVGYLSGEGLSTRAIAPIVGVHHDTVASDIKKAPVGNPTPGLPSVPVPFMDEQVAEITATEPPDDLDVSVNFETGEVIEKPRKITGLDGKTYTHPQPSAEARERAEAERAAQQEWAAYRDLYSGLARSVSTLAGHATRAPEHLFRHFEDGMFTPIEEREFTPERMRLAVETLTKLIAWKESGE